MKGLKKPRHMKFPKKKATAKTALKFERKNWHLTQILGAILFASEDPETGFTMAERDVLSVDIADVELHRELDDKGVATLTVRIKAEPQKATQAA